MAFKAAGTLQLTTATSNNDSNSKNEFPLLHSLGIQKECQMSTLLTVKHNGSNLCINFMPQNNFPGFVILCPSSRSAKQHTSELMKKCPIDSLPDDIFKSTKCNKREKAECKKQSA
jgi:hypothetical protein